jgi:hypothetical protein
MFKNLLDLTVVVSGEAGAEASGLVAVLALVPLGLREAGKLGG